LGDRGNVKKRPGRDDSGLQKGGLPPRHNTGASQVCGEGWRTGSGGVWAYRKGRNQKKSVMLDSFERWSGAGTYEFSG